DHLYVGVEPRWYVPIIPMILINGAVGIASGWSTNIPNFSPKDVIQNLKQKINGENMIPMHPWYHGFHGEIEEVEANKYISHGIIEKINDTCILISELPVRKWTEDYKSKNLTNLIKNNYIESFNDNSVNERVNLEIKLNAEQ